MNSATTRGYIMKQMLAYVDAGFEGETRARVLAAVTPETLEITAKAKAAEWYPVVHLNRILSAIVSARNDDQKSAEDVMAAGRFVAAEATNTFLRILMKLMTPTLFLRKIPDFWPRDFSVGQWKCDASEADAGLMKMSLHGVSDLQHVAVSAMGFVSAGLAAVGKPEAKITQRGWSVATPSPADVYYEVKWT